MAALPESASRTDSPWVSVAATLAGGGGQNPQLLLPKGTPAWVLRVLRTQLLSPSTAQTPLPGDQLLTSKEPRRRTLNV